MTDGSEMGDSSGTAVAAQSRPEVVVRTVREVSDTSWPTLTRTNYGEWSVTMKVKFRARRLWNAVDKGTDNEEDDRHGGGTRVNSRIMGRLLDNLLLPCMYTREGGAERPPAMIL